MLKLLMWRGVLLLVALIIGGEEGTVDKTVELAVCHSRAVVVVMSEILALSVEFPFIMSFEIHAP